MCVSAERAMILWIIDENENSGDTFSYLPGIKKTPAVPPGSLTSAA